MRRRSILGKRPNTEQEREYDVDLKSLRRVVPEPGSVSETSEKEKIHGNQGGGSLSHLSPQRAQTMLNQESPRPTGPKVSEPIPKATGDAATPGRAPVDAATLGRPATPDSRASRTGGRGEGHGE